MESVSGHSEPVSTLAEGSSANKTEENKDEDENLRLSTASTLVSFSSSNKDPPLSPDVSGHGVRRPPLHDHPSTKALPSTRRLSTIAASLTIDKLKFTKLGLVGREKEIDLLLESLNKVKSGTASRAVTLIKGQSGTGKSVLARTLESPATKKKGIFTESKYDAQTSLQPYSGIVKCCSLIVGHILWLEIDNVELSAEMRQQIQSELANELDVLLPIIPTLEEILEEEEDDGGVGIGGSGTSGKNISYYKRRLDHSAMSAATLKNRVFVAFRKVFRVFARCLSPLVMVLDDLQWADKDSLALLEYIVKDPSIEGLMMIGTYRSNEVDDSHDVSKFVEGIQGDDDDDNLLFSQIETNDLDVESILEMIQELLSAENNPETRSLADICMHKTNGNPFFLKQFLTMLYQKELLEYNYGLMSWTWDIDEIKRNTEASENVVQLLNAKISSLPKAMNDLIRIASIMESSFEVRSLRIVCDAVIPDMSRDFDEALEAIVSIGYFIAEPRSEGRYCWSHDKVKESAWGLVPEEEQSSLMVLSGKALRRRLTRKEIDSSIYMVTDLLNAASEQPQDEDERIALVEQNLEAAKKAMRFSAFTSASKYSRKGIGLLPERRWQKCRHLCLDLYAIGAKSEDYLGNSDVLEVYYNEVMGQDDIPPEYKLGMLGVWIDNLGARGRFAEATDLLLRVMEKHGCSFPRFKAAALFSTVRQMLQAKSKAKSFYVSKLCEMKDVIRTQMIKLLDKLGYCMYVCNDHRVALPVLTSLKWTEKYGYNDHSSTTLANVGMMLIVVLSDIHGGAAYGEQALALQHQCRSRSSEARAAFTVYSTQFAWSKPLQSNLPHLFRAYECGFETGDIESAGLSIFEYMEFRFVLGYPLQQMRDDHRLYSNQMKDLKRDQTWTIIRLQYQAISNLMSDKPHTELHGRILSADELEGCQGIPILKALSAYFKGYLLVYFGKYEEYARIISKEGPDALAKAMPGTPRIYWDMFLKGVACFAAYQSTGKRAYAKLGNGFLRKLRKFQDNGCPNVHCYIPVLEAEVAVMKGKPLDAIKLYESTIAVFARGGMIQNAALVSERLAYVYALPVASDEEERKFRLQEAQRYWRDWGATAKVNQMEEEYQFLTPHMPDTVDVGFPND